MTRTTSEPRGARRWPRLGVVATAAASIGIVGSAGVSAAHAPEVHPVGSVTTTTPSGDSSETVEASGSTLPETGLDTGLQLAVALSAVSAGTALVVVARRRRQTSPDA